MNDDRAALLAVAQDLQTASDQYADDGDADSFCSSVELVQQAVVSHFFSQRWPQAG